MIATPQQSLEAAAQAAREAGVEAHILSDEMEGESREVGKVHAALARAVAHRGVPFARPCVILSGGETTVTIRPRQPGQAKGRGGPGRRVLHGAGGRAHGPAAGVGAGRRHRRHRRRGRQRGRLRHARHAGARRGGGPQAVRPPRPQRRLRLLRRHRRPVGHRARRTTRPPARRSARCPRRQGRPGPRTGSRAEGLRDLARHDRRRARSKIMRKAAG
jgi:hypothetical protein